MLANLLSVVIERLDEISAKMDSGVQASHSSTEKHRDFASYIKCKDKVNEILSLLHAWIDSKDKVKALVYIKAAIEAQVLSRPPYHIADAEFPGRLGCKSLYYAYPSEPMAFTDEGDLEELRKAILSLQS